MSDREQALRGAAQDLADAVEPMLGTMDFYFGPNARTGVSLDVVKGYERIRDARAALVAALSSDDGSGAGAARR